MEEGGSFSSGSRVQLGNLLPVLLALWWTVLFLPQRFRSHMLLGLVAMLLLLLGHNTSADDLQDGARADVRITTPR